MSSFLPPLDVCTPAQHVSNSIELITCSVVARHAPCISCRSPMNASSGFCKPWPRQPCGNGETLNSPCTQTSAACWTSRLCLQVAGDHMRFQCSGYLNHKLRCRIHTLQGPNQEGARCPAKHTACVCKVMIPPIWIPLARTLHCSLCPRSVPQGPGGRHAGGWLHALPHRPASRARCGGHAVYRGTRTVCGCSLRLLRQAVRSPGCCMRGRGYLLRVSDSRGIPLILDVSVTFPRPGSLSVC